MLTRQFGVFDPQTHTQTHTLDTSLSSQVTLSMPFVKVGGLCIPIRSIGRAILGRHVGHRTRESKGHGQAAAWSHVADTAQTRASCDVLDASHTVEGNDKWASKPISRLSSGSKIQK